MGGNEAVTQAETAAYPVSVSARWTLKNLESSLRWARENGNADVIACIEMTLADCRAWLKEGK